MVIMIEVNAHYLTMRQATNIVIIVRVGMTQLNLTARLKMHWAINHELVQLDWRSSLCVWHDSASMKPGKLME